MKKKGKFRKTILKIHEILGLLTGIVVFIVCATGCLWVFKDEIESFYHDYKYINPEKKPPITSTQAKIAAQKILPNRHIHGTVFGKSNEAVEVIFYESNPVFYQSVFLNAYSGELIKVVNHRAGFFSFVLDGHMYLWLPQSVGSKIVSYSILLFLVILMSGLILWWPKNKKAGKQRFYFQWNDNTRWKRKNFDLHTVVGFYVMTFAFILAFTGSVMAFNWFYYLTYKAIGGDKQPQFIIPTNIDKIQEKNPLAIDLLIPRLKKRYPDAENFEIHYPATDSSSIYVEVSNSSGVYYNSDYLFFDQNTLQEIGTASIYGKYKDAKFADKVIRMNYDIHVGAIGGILGKIIAFLASLITASLPITGFILWWNRSRKKYFQTKRKLNTRLSEEYI